MHTCSLLPRFFNRFNNNCTHINAFTCTSQAVYTYNLAIQVCRCLTTYSCFFSSISILSQCSFCDRKFAELVLTDVTLGYSVDEMVYHILPAYQIPTPAVRKKNKGTHP